MNEIKIKKRIKKNDYIDILGLPLGLPDNEVVKLIGRWAELSHSDASAFAHKMKFHYIIIKNKDILGFVSSYDWDVYLQLTEWEKVGELIIEANNDWDSDDKMYLAVKYSLEYKNLKDEFFYSVDFMR